MLKKEPSLSSLGSDGNTSFLRAARAGHLDKVLEHLKSNIDINTSNANGLNALHLASKDGHVDVVAELLKRGAIVDAATKKGNTALHIASLAGQEEVVKLLVQHGASVNVQSQNGFTPLYMAAQENHDNVVKYLLSNGANQSLATEDGFTPLAVAMQQGHDKVVTVLLENDTRGKVRLPALHIAAKKDDVKAAKLLLENEHNPDVTSKSGFTPLHIASHYGNESIANLLIHKGADVNYAAKHNITPLHVAAKWGKTNMVALLLENGANIESKTRDGLTPLHCAARSGHEQVVDMLLERGAPISCKTKNGLAPLHMAAQGDHVDAARILLYHRAPVDEVTVDYLTALHVAAHCGHVRVAKLLLDRQADANARALNGFTPLHIACKKNRIKVVELLLKHGASIGATTESGLTPLHVASFMGCMNIVIYLLQHDANPDVPTVRGETPLHLAARANQTDIIRILLRNGAQVDARAREQQTPLHIASRLGNVDIVMLLLQHGAKVDTTTKDMYTALHIAAKEGQDEVAAVLIENGASLNANTKKGFTPLHLASKYGNIKVAKLLLQKEASVDAQGKNGVTPLHVASHYDHQNVALLLLDKGASPHATAKNGHTPLHIAARKNQMDIANTLLEYGAKPNAESKAGFTPLHLSAQEGHTDMSSLLIEHEANTNHPARNGLTPLHLCAQEDRVPVAEILVKNGSKVDAATTGGFTPLHIASHYGQINMVKFLLANGANVGSKTSLDYTPLHQAAQQGHTNIVNILLEHKAQPNVVTTNGQTPLNIAQKLGYISVIETLKIVTETTTTTTTIEEKYKVVAPEAMQETFMSDSEEEGGEDTVLGDHSYRYLTADEMKSLGDDSLPIDVTRDERIDSNKMVNSEEQNALPPQAIEDGISPQYITENYVEYTKKYTPDNVDIGRHPINIGFLVSFLVDARGGAMRGCRHSGVRVIVPPRCAPSPTRITCRYVRPQRTPHPPPLMEGEALASRVLELGPVGAKFLGPVIIEVPHFAALRGKEREIVILRSDNGETWREHTVESAEDILSEVLSDSFEAEDLSQLEDVSSGRITRVVTHDFPQYFAIVTRIRQEVHAIGPEGGMVSSTVVPQVQAVFPQGALTKKIKVGLQAQPIDPELAAKLLGHGVAVSPVVTVEPRRRKFHKAITLSMPAPRAHSQGMINQYSGNAPTLRLLCSITGGTTRAQWEDVTGSTPLTFVNDCVSFTTTVSARFWLMDCRNIGDATKMATELYKEAIHVPFMAKFVVFAKRIDPLEARLRVFCMTDDKEDKTLEQQEHFTEVAKSRDVEVLEGKPQYIEFAGNLVPITKSGEPLQFSFRAFRENRLPFSVRVKDQHAEAVGRCLFMREPKVAKGEPPQQPICILNIVLPDDIVSETVTLADNETIKRHMFLKDNFEYYRPDPRLADMSNLLGEDWVPLATQLGLTPSEINVIKSEYPDSVAKQAQSMLRMWISQSGNKAQGDALENALMRIGREDIIPQCLNVDDVDRIPRIPKEVMQRYQKDIDTVLESTPSKPKETYESKYSAEEKIVDEPSDEEDFNKSVLERRQQIEKRLTEPKIPASIQRQEIAEEITSIKRQSLVEDKIAEVEVKQKPDQTKTTTIIKTVTTDTVPEIKTIAETVETTKTTTTPGYQPNEVTVKKQFMEEEKPDRKTTIRTIITETRTTEHIPSNEITLLNDIIADRRDSDLLEGVTQILETTKKVTPRISTSDDPNSPKFSKTPPPSPADFIFREQAAAIQGWSAPDGQSRDKPTEAVAKQGAALQGIPTSTTKHLASSEELSLDSPKLEKHVANENDLDTLAQKTNAFIDIESRREPDRDLRTVSHESRPNEKTKTLSRDSSREDTSRTDDKKSKKGFFGTLKSIVGKSQDRSDSESEKSQKKEKKKKKDKKKKPKHPPAEPPERPPRKPKLPTPPPSEERPEFENIPYVEASPTDQRNGEIHIRDDNNVQTTDLDVTNEVPDHIKSAANDLVSDVIITSETKAQDILETRPTRKQIVIKEEIKKTIETKVYDTGEFHIVVSPTTEPKIKDFFKAEVDEQPSKIETKLTETSTKPVTPIRPQRRKEHIYEDIGEPIFSQPPIKLIYFDAEPISDIKLQTTNLIQNEINFAGWADDKYNIYKPSDIKDKEYTLPRSGKKHGKLFGFLAKKSSKDVDEFDNEKETNKEIIEKQDREPSKERVIKAESLSDEEGADQKKGSFFGIFGKKSKKEDELKLDKEVIPKKETESEIQTETKPVEAPILEIKESLVETDAIKEQISKPAEEPKPKERKKNKKEKVLSESEDESEHKKSGLFGFFGKKTKKDVKEEHSKPIQLSESVVQDMKNSANFLETELKYFEDVKTVKPKPDTTIPIPSETPKIDETEVLETKPLVEIKPEVMVQKREKTPTKMKTKKYRQEKRDSSVSEDESEGRKSGIFGLFGKKHKKDKSREKSPKIVDEIKLSDEVRKQMADTNNFLDNEVKLFDDVKPINGYVSVSTPDETKLTKEQISLNDATAKEPKETISKDTKVEHILIKEGSKFDPVTKQDIITSQTEIIRETITTQSIVEEPRIVQQIKTLKDIEDKRKPKIPTVATEESRTITKETITYTVDGKPVKEIQRIVEETLPKTADDETLLNIAKTTNFLQDEIDHFNDVKPIPKEPLVKEEKLEIESKKTSTLDKKKIKKEKQESLSDDDSESQKKGGFFGLFSGKKAKKDDNKKKEEILKEIVLSEEVVRNMTNCNQFLTTEITNFEDVKPIIKLVEEEKIEKVAIKPKTDEKKLTEVPTTISEPKLNEELIVTSTKSENFLQEEIEHFNDVKPLIKDTAILKESAKIKTEIVSEEDKKKRKKEKNKKKDDIEMESQESLDDQKKGGFFDIFSKKSKKPKEEPSKEIDLSEVVKKNMEDSNQFLVKEVANFDDVRPIIKKIEEKHEKVERSAEENIVGTTQTADFLKDEIDHFEDVQNITKEHKLPEKETIYSKKKYPPKTDAFEVISRKEDVQVVDKKKSKKDKTEDDQSDSSKKGFFGLFGKKSKKEEKPSEENVSDETVKNIAGCDKFLIDEVTNFEDVRPIIKQEISETPITKTAIQFDKSVEKVLTESDEAKLKITQTDDFLKDEIQKFHDVKEIIDKSSEKTKPKPQIIKETIIVQRDVPTEQVLKVLDGKEIEEEITKEQVSLDVKKKTSEEPNTEKDENISKKVEVDKKKSKKDKTEDDQSELPKKVGFFGLFGKKSKKDEKSSEERDSQEVAKNMADCDKFLIDEVTHFEDVRPIIRYEISERLITKTEIKPEKSVERVTKERKEAKLNIADTADFLKDEIEKFHDVKEIIDKSPEKSKPKPKIIKETIIVQRDVPTEEVLKVLDGTEIEEKITKEQVSLDVKKKTPEEPKIEKDQKISKKEEVEVDKKKSKKHKTEADHSESPKKVGFFGLFGKKSKKDEKLSEERGSQEVVKNMADCDKFLIDEILHFEDVRPIIKQEISETVITKTEIKPEKIVEKVIKESEEADAKLERAHTADFLKDEIEKFHDVKEIIDKSPEKLQPKPQVIKETIIVPRDVPTEEILKALDGKEIEDKIIKEQVSLDVEKQAPEKPIIEKDPNTSKKEEVDRKKSKQDKTEDDQSESQKKVGFFGLFGKKSKKDEKSEERDSQEAIKNIAECDKFLIDEVTNFEDVRPIIKQEISETVITKTVLKREKSAEKMKESDEVKLKIAHTADFLKDEIEKFNDVKEIIESPEKLKAKPQITKETIMVQGDAPSEEILKNIDGKEIEVNIIKIQMSLDDKKTPDGPKIEEDQHMKKEKVQIDKKKSKKDNSEDDQSESSKKGGFFGIFGKKTKKEEKSTEQDPQEVAKRIDTCDKFLMDEVTHFEDVRPIVKQEISETLITKTEIKPDKGIKKEMKETEEASLKIAHTAGFLKDEIEKFHDVKEIINKSPEKPKPKPQIIKETIIVQSDAPTEEILKILNDKEIEDKIIKKEVSMDEKKEKPEELKSEDQNKGFFGIFGKKSKKEDNKSKQNEDNLTLKDTKYSKETLETLGNCDNFLKDEIKHFEDVKPVIRHQPVETPVFEDSKIEIVSKAPVEEKVLQRLQQQSPEHLQNVAMTTTFLLDEIKYFEDVKPVIKETTSEHTEVSPKKGKHKKKSKRETSESGDESDGSKKSSLFKFFGKKGKKDKLEGKDGKVLEEATAEQIILKTEILESSKEAPNEKSKPERKDSQKKTKKDKTEESSKSLFGLFGKKDRNSTEIPDVEKAVISDITLKNMKDSSDFLSTEIEKFHDVKKIKPQVIISDVINLDGKMTIAEITKTLEPKIYEHGEFQVVVSPTTEATKREFSVSIADKVEKLEEAMIPSGKLISTTTETISSQPKILAQDVFDEISGVTSVSDKSTSQVELSQEVLKHMVDTSNFLNQEVSRFYDVRPIVKEREKTPLSDGEDVKNKKKRKKKERQKSSEDGRKSGFFGLFGKREKKSESPESNIEIKKVEEQTTEKEFAQKRMLHPETLKSFENQQIGEKEVYGVNPLDFMENVHLTNNFLNDEIKNYHDVRPIPLTFETPITATTELKEDLAQKESEHKSKSKSLFGLFGRKSEEHSEEQYHPKETSLKEKRERRKSGSPFRLFSKKSKDEEKSEEIKPAAKEEKSEEIKPVISEEALQNMYETKNFLSTEVMRYTDGSYKIDDKHVSEVKKTVAFVDDTITKIKHVKPSAIATTTMIVKEIADDGKVKVEAVFKEIKEDVQPTEKVIVVIKDDVSEAAKTTREMKFSPDIISEITADIPPDSKIKEIHIETIEVDDDVGKLGEISQQQIEELTKSLNEKGIKTESSIQLSSFLESERSFANANITDSKPEEISQQFQEIAANVLELTKELDATVGSLEAPQDSKKPSLEKQDSKKKRKSGGFFSKLGEKIGGKTKDTKDTLDDTGTRIIDEVSDTVKEVQQDIQEAKITTDTKASKTKDSAKDIHDEIVSNIQTLEAEANMTIDEMEKNAKKLQQDKIEAANQYLKNKEELSIDGTYTKVTDISEILQSEIDNITKALLDTSEPKQTDASDKIGSEIKDIAQVTSLAEDQSKEADKERVETAITEQVTTKSKGQSKKPGKKSGGFFSKLGDKFSIKTKDIKDEGKHLAEKIDDELTDMGDEIKMEEESIRDTARAISETISDRNKSLEKTAQENEDKIESKIIETGKVISEIGAKINSKTQETSEDIEMTKKDYEQETHRLVNDSAETVSEAEKMAATEVQEKIQKISAKGNDALAVAGNIERKPSGLLKDVEDKSAEIIKDIVSAKGEANKTSDRVNDVLTTTSEEIKDELKQDSKSLSENAEKKGKEFFATTTQIQEYIKDDVSDSVKDINTRTQGKLQEITETTEGTVEDLQTKADDFFNSLPEKIKDIEKDIVTSTKEGENKVTEKAESVSDNIKEGTKKSKDKIGGFFSGLGKKSKQTKEDILDKTKDISTTVESKTTEAAEAVKHEVKYITKQIDDLNNVREQRSDTAQNTSDKVKEETNKLEVKQESSSKGVKEGNKKGKGKIGGFFSSLGKSAKESKGDIQEKIEDCTAAGEDKTKEAVQSAEQISEDIKKESNDFLSDTEKKAGQLTKNITSSKREIEAEAAEKGTVILTAVSEDAKHTTATIQKGAITLAENISDRLETDKIAITKLFEDFEKSSNDVKEDISDQGTLALQKETADLSKQTSDFLSHLQEHASETAKETSDKSKQQQEKVKDKDTNILEQSSKVIKAGVEPIKQEDESISKDIKDSTRKSKGKIGGFFSSLGKSTKDAKDELSENIKIVSGVIQDKTEQRTVTVEETRQDAEKKIGDSLTDSGQKTADLTNDIISSVKEVETKTIKESGGILTLVSEGEKDKIAKAEQKVENIKSDFQTSANTIDDVFSGFSEKAKYAKDDASQKVKDITAEVTDETKKMTEGVQKSSDGLAKQTNNFLNNLREQASDTVQATSDKFKAEEQKVKGKSSDALSAMTETVMEKADVIKHEGESLSENIKKTTKEGKGTIGEFFNSLGESIKDTKKDLQEETENIGKAVGYTTKDTIQSTEQAAKDIVKQTEDGLNKVEQKTQKIAKDVTFSIEDSEEKSCDVLTTSLDEVKGKASTVEESSTSISENIEDSLGACKDTTKDFFISLGEKGKHIKADISEKAKESSVAVEDKAKQTLQSVQKHTEDIVQQTGDFLTNARQQTTETTQTAFDKVTETGQTGNDLLTETSKTIKNKAQSIKDQSEVLSKNAKKSAKKGKSKSRVCFSGLSQSAEDAKDDFREVVKDVEEVVEEKIKKPIQTVEKSAADITMGVDNFLKDTKDLETVEQNRATPQHRIESLSEDIVDSVKTSRDKAGKFFSDLNEKTKEDISNKTKATTAIVDDKIQRTTEDNQKAAESLAKETSNFLSHLQEQTSEAIQSTADKIKKDEEKLKDKVSDVLTVTSEAYKDKTELIKEQGKSLSKDIKETTKKSKGKIGGFFTSLGKNTKATKDDMREKAKDVSMVIEDKAKETVETIEQTAKDVEKRTEDVLSKSEDQIKETNDAIQNSTTDMTKQTHDFLRNLQEQASETFQSTSNNIKEETKVKLNVVDDGIASTKQQTQSLSKDVKEGVKKSKNKIGGFFSSLGKSAKDAKDEVCEKATDIGVSLEYQTKEVTEATENKTAELTKDATTNIKREVNKPVTIGSDILTSTSKDIKAKTAAIQQDTETLFSDVKEKLKTSEDEAKDFSSSLGEKTANVKEDVSEKIKQTSAVLDKKTNETIQTAQKDIDDFETQTSNFLSHLRKEASVTAQGTSDKILDKSSKACKVVEEKADLIKQEEKLLSTDIKEGAEKSTSTIGGFLSSLGETARDTKGEVSDKARDIDVIDKMKKAETCIEGKEDLMKQTDDFLINLKKQTSEEIKDTTDEIKEDTSKVFSAMSEPAERNIESAIYDSESLSKKITDDIEKSKSTVGGFFSSFGKSAVNIKDSISDKTKSISQAAEDKSKEAVHCTNETTKEIGEATGSILQDVREKTTDLAKEATINIKKDGSKNVEKSRDGLASSFEVFSDEIPAIKQEDEFPSTDVKKDILESKNTVGESFYEVSQKTKDIKENLSTKVKDITENKISETTQKATDLTMQSQDLFSSFQKQEKEKSKDVSDIVQEDSTKVVEKGFEVISTSPAAKDKGTSVKEETESLSQEVKIGTKKCKGKIGEFFSGLDKSTKDAKDVIFGKDTVTEDATKIDAQSVVDSTKDITKKTGDFLNNLRQQTTELSKDTSDQIKEDLSKTMTKGSDATRTAAKAYGEMAAVVKDTSQCLFRDAKGNVEEGSDSIREILSDLDETVKDTGKDVDQKSKGVKDTIKDSSEALGDLFSFGKKKNKKTKTGNNDKPVLAEAIKGKHVSKHKEVKTSTSDMDAFLFHERAKLLEEGEFPQTTTSPLVTSPTLPRRVASQRIPRGDVPYFVDVTHIPYDDSSSDESYIVTEPTDRHSARISDDSLIKSGPKRKPLFHIESEEDSFDRSHRGSIKSNILENVSAQRLETLVTDLDDIDDTVPSDTQFTSNVLFEANKDAKTPSQIDTDTIEQKLSDIEKALGTLEQAETVESVNKEKPSLKRVERKFERMASELMAESTAEASDSNLTIPEVEEKHEQDFRQIVSQLSTEEVSECQREYAALWDEQTFSPSDGWDTSKTPDSQADVLELPQGDIIYMGPVTLNRDNLVNKAGVEVDVIPIMKSPCPSPIPRRRSSKRAKSELGFRSKQKHDPDRGSLPNLHTYKKGIIMDTIKQRSPNLFLSRNACTDSNESINSILKSDDRMAKSLGSADSLPKGLIMNAVVSWLHKSSPFGSTDNMTQSFTSNQTSAFDEIDLMEASTSSRHDNQVPDIFISEDEVLVVPRQSPKLSRRARRKNKRSKIRREKCSVEQTPLGESYVTQQRTEQQSTPQTLARAEAEESASQIQTEQDRPIADQHMLSDEMKRLLKELEEESKK